MRDRKIKIKFSKFIPIFITAFSYMLTFPEFSEVSSSSERLSPSKKKIN